MRILRSTGSELDHSRQPEASVSVSILQQPMQSRLCWRKNYQQELSKWHSQQTIAWTSTYCAPLPSSPITIGLGVFSLAVILCQCHETGNALHNRHSFLAARRSNRDSARARLVSTLANHEEICQRLQNPVFINSSSICIGAEGVRGFPKHSPILRAIIGTTQLLPEANMEMHGRLSGLQSYSTPCRFQIESMTFEAAVLCF
jgi:hypothetical protein